MRSFKIGDFVKGFESGRHFEGTFKGSCNGLIQVSTEHGEILVDPKWDQIELDKTKIIKLFYSRT